MKAANMYSRALLLLTLCSVGFSESENIAYRNNYQRGIDAVRQGDLKKARANFSTALFYKPGDVNAQKGLEMTEERLLIQKPQKGNNQGTKQYWFLRLSAAAVPGIDKDPDDHGAYEKDDGSPDIQVEGLVVKRSGLADGTRYGWLLGGGAFLARHTGTDEMEDDYNRLAGGLMIQTGIVARFGEQLYVELVPYFGLGVTEVVIDAYVQRGIKLGAYFPVGKRELGLEAGYANFYTNIDSGSGLRLALVLSL